jgi:hypothetical protein
VRTLHVKQEILKFLQEKQANYTAVDFPFKDAKQVADTIVERAWL